MRKYLLPLVVAAVTLFNYLSLAGQGPAAIAFTNVTVVPMDRERVIENQTVIVRDGKVAEIGAAASVRVPQGATIVDARGKFLMPGLSDMHGHLPPGDGSNPESAIAQFMSLYVANGVTTVRGMIGHPTNLQLRDRIARGELAGPAIFAAGPAVNQKLAPTPEDGKKIVEEHKAAGFDLIKVHAGISPETYAAMNDAAKRVGIKLAGHVWEGIGLDRALEAKQSSIEHLDGYLQALVPADAPAKPVPGQVQFGPALQHMDERKIPELAARTKAANVWNTPTLALFQIVVSTEPPAVFLEWPEMRYIAQGMRDGFAKQKSGTANIPASPEDRKRYVDLRNKIVKGLHDAGAKLLVGPDTPQMFLVPGFATHREMGSFVGAGLSPFAALQAATTSAAEYLGRADAGTVAAGKRADLLLVDANPLANIAHARQISGVVLNGRWIPKAEIDKMLEEIAARHK